VTFNHYILAGFCKALALFPLSTVLKRYGNISFVAAQQNADIYNRLAFDMIPILLALIKVCT